MISGSPGRHTCADLGFSGCGAKGTQTPDPLRANYAWTGRDSAPRALTSSFCSAQIVTVRRRCYRKQLQIDRVPTVGSVHSARVGPQAGGVVGASVGPADGRAAYPGVRWPDEREALVKLRRDLLLVPNRRYSLRGRMRDDR